MGSEKQSENAFCPKRGFFSTEMIRLVDLSSVEIFEHQNNQINFMCLNGEIPKL